MSDHLTISQKETEYYFLRFCSFICIINNKKLNLPNIFLLILKNAGYRSLFKELLCIETNYEVVETFIKYDPTLCNSKYLSKFLNSKKGTDIF
jgi:hypothetical protein